MCCASIGKHGVDCFSSLALALLKGQYSLASKYIVLVCIVSGRHSMCRTQHSTFVERVVAVCNNQKHLNVVAWMYGASRQRWDVRK